MINILNLNKSKLGEGLYINTKEKIIAWVDILSSQIFFTNFNYSTLLKFNYPFLPSNIFFCDKNKAIILDNVGIHEFYWKDHSIKKICIFPKNIVPEGCRTNDGIKILNETFLFGVMHKSDPAHYKGSVWLIKDGQYIKIQNNHIPNSFINIGKEILITDSFTKIIYRYSIESKIIQGIWHNYSKKEGDPDGGFFSSDHFVYLAMWSASKIVKFDKDGNFISQLILPAKYPTNCKQLQDKLIVTTASSFSISKKKNSDNIDGSLIETNLF